MSGKELELKPDDVSSLHDKNIPKTEDEYKYTWYKQQEAKVHLLSPRLILRFWPFSQPTALWMPVRTPTPSTVSFLISPVSMERWVVRSLILVLFTLESTSRILLFFSNVLDSRSPSVWLMVATSFTTARLKPPLLLRPLLWAV